jgi:hypothetical protein
MQHNDPSRLSPIQALSARRRRPPILRPIQLISPAPPAHSGVWAIVRRHWIGLVLVGILITLGICLLGPRASPHQELLPSYPNGINVIHTVTVNDVGDNAYRMCCGTLFEQTVTFQTVDPVDTVLAFYRTHRPIQPNRMCQIAEQTTNSLTIECMSYKLEGPDQNITYRASYQITVTSISDQLRAVQAKEWRGAVQGFNPDQRR